MITFLIVLLIAIILASIIFAVIRKAVKVVFFLALVLVIFIVVAGLIWPEVNVYQKGKNYILEKSERVLEAGEDEAVSYVVLESNQTQKPKLMPGAVRD